MTIKVTTDNYEIIIYKTVNGWLCTINILEDNEVSFGSTGNFQRTPKGALANSINYLKESWSYDLSIDKLKRVFHAIK